MYGVLLEQTSDESGFANVGWIDTGDWLEYKINVPVEDNYSILFRAASTKNATIDVLIDGVNKVSQNLPSTGGWQNWSTFESSLDLTSGQHTIRLHAATDGFNLNWFQIGEPVVTNINPIEPKKLVIFPNPVSDQLFVQYDSPGSFSIKITDLSGRILSSAKFNRSNWLDVSSLEQGIYLVTLSNQKSSTSRRIMVR